jgi:hypothetical protein
VQKKRLLLVALALAYFWRTPLRDTAALKLEQIFEGRRTKRQP